jgi:hypothetical protein
VVLARIPLRHLLVPIQNGFDPVLNELNHPFEGIASFVSQCEANRPSTRITRIGELYLGGRRRLVWGGFIGLMRGVASFHEGPEGSQLAEMVIRPAQRLGCDPEACQSGGFSHPRRMSHLASNRYHDLPGKRRTA